ncbi:MAG TPA: hypothetical protein PKL56_11835 [Cyclobacteriaceae bacterium]|nr:hypothetical protein [Cyclobacteriaceae bacterium]HMV07484.1 hypothetical protein [Cyclobacteriaceae bacterium]HMW99161.1 hypothetical protein [Cyclobacteriaceae bacterium]HMX48206.1 hypothetical protein [Cyclobacteriaceae bacterium]HMY95011.1 hypothetical protein [Cyclobacteriaceae bacterium]
MEPYRKVAEIAEKFKSIVPEIPAQVRVIESLSLLSQQIAALHVSEHISAFTKQFETFRGLGIRLKDLVEGTPEVLLLLSKYGWYVESDNALTFYEYLGLLIREERIDELDSCLSEYYSENLEAIIDNLCERHPDRSHLFRDIESGHLKKLYSLSIPSTLSQVDGISHDFFNKKFFIKDRKTYLPEISAEIIKISESTVELLISPLTSNTPIIAREIDLHEFPIRLNRHEILHGVDKSYGTELNSLKCISLLKYLSDILTQLK